MRFLTGYFCLVCLVCRFVSYYWQVLKRGGLPPKRALQLRKVQLTGLPPGSAGSYSLVITVYGCSVWKGPSATTSSSGSSSQHGGRSGSSRGRGQERDLQTRSAPLMSATEDCGEMATAAAAGAAGATTAEKKKEASFKSSLALAFLAGRGFGSSGKKQQQQPVAGGGVGGAGAVGAGGGPPVLTGHGAGVVYKYHGPEALMSDAGESLGRYVDGEGMAMTGDNLHGSWDQGVRG